ncbi:MAG: DUF1995 family protein, partial [Cyanothece sp. SIO1E1]|nr:DUF1995 family protein [Cyanothece sp. SIO1E1]
KVYFPDAGAAALARRDWGELPFSVRGMKEIKGQMEPDDDVFLLVEPSAVEVLDVEKMVEAAGNRPFVMLNPKMEDIAIVGIGYAARQLRERFIKTFESCYYLKPLENCTILRCYPDPWQVWQETEADTYQLLAEVPQKPTAEVLEQILATTTDNISPDTPATEVAKPKQNLLSGLQQFLRALSQ